MKQPKIDSFRSPRTQTPEAVSMPEAARPIKKTETNNPSSNGNTERTNGNTERANGNTERANGNTERANGVTEHTNGNTERLNRTDEKNSRKKSVLNEMSQGVLEANKRPTERYSFEIYTDQKQKIRDLQYQYEKRMGKRLSSSRIIREAIEVYLAKTLNLERG